MTEDEQQRRQHESDTYNARGIEAADRKWYDEAVRAFKRALELDPTSAHAHDNLATVYSEQGKYILALKEYLEALRIEPDNPTAHYNLACFLTTHAHEMAIRVPGSDQVEYDYPDAHVNLGPCFADAGEHTSAIEFRVATELGPGDIGVRQELAARSSTPAVRRGHPPPRTWSGSSPPTSTRTRPGHRVHGARLLCRAELLPLASSRAPDEVLLRYHLAALYAAWNRPEEAIRRVGEALELDRERVLEWLESDRAFDLFRADPEFRRLTERR
jgi:tetratricopeptide (TPR) repeat protein